MVTETKKARFFASGLMVFFAALALRAAPVAWHRLDESRVSTTDSGRYLELADRLAAGDGFVLPDPESGAAAPELFRTPGYPLFLALAGGLPGSRVAWVLGLQIVAGAATATLSFLLFSAWASPRAGLLAAALLAVDPSHVLYSNLLMSDVLCGAAITAALLLLAGGWRSPGGGQAEGASWRFTIAGGLLSAATALRPVAVLLVVPAAVYLRRRGVAWPGVAALVAAALLFPAGWTARNGLAAGSWTLSSAFDVNLALVVASRVEARAGGLSRSAAEARVMARVDALALESARPRHRACRRVGLDALRAAPAAAMIEVPAAAAEMLLAGERRYLMQVFGRPASEGRERRTRGMPWPVSSYTRFELLATSAQVAFMAAVWILAVAGILALWRRGRADVALFVLFALAVVLAPSLVVGTGRMRLPVAALVHGLAGVGGAALASGEFRRPAAG